MTKERIHQVLGITKEDGQIKGTGYERFNGALSGSYKVFPFLTVKAATTYSWSTQPELWIGTYEMFYRTRSQRAYMEPLVDRRKSCFGSRNR